MSKISLKPNASGTGVFSLEAPNSNVDRTLNLPDEAGTVLTNVSDIESQVKTATNATGSAPVYACRAWVNYDSNNSNIRASGNVSSITDNNTGQHTINFTTSMPDADYNILATAGGGGGLDGDASAVTLDSNFGSTSQSPQIRVRNYFESNANLTDVDYLYVAFIR